MKRIIALLMAGTVLCGVWAESTEDRWAESAVPALRPVLERALVQSPRLLERNLDLAQSKADWYVQRASSFPSVSAYGTMQWQYEDRLDRASASVNDRTYYNVSINQPVWHWGALEASRKIAAINRQLAEMNAAEAYRALALEIRASYLSLMLGRIALRNAENQERLAQKNLERQRVRLEADQVTARAVRLAEWRVEEAALARRRLRVDLDYSLDAFRALVGAPDFSEDDVASEAAALSVPPTLPAVADPAAPRYYALRVAELEVKKARQSQVAPRYALFPRFSLVAGVSRDEVNRDVDLYKKYQVDLWYVGAQVNWTLFDGFNSKGQRMAALTRLRRAERKQETTAAEIARTDGKERANVEFTWDAYRFARRRELGTLNNINRLEAEQQRGNASDDQIDTARVEADAASYAAQAALVAHLNATAQYLSSLGLDPFARPVGSP